MRKRKTLPNDFEEIAKRGNIDEIKSVLDKCEINAIQRSNKSTALMCPYLPEEIVRYLVEQGNDINQPNRYDSTPLIEAIVYNPERIPLLLELGADINFHAKFGKTALGQACITGNIEAVNILIDNGADMNIRCYYNNITPLELGLSFCNPIDIVKTEKMAEVMLERGAEITEQAKKYVTDIGKEFEFYRDGFNPEYLDEIDDALQKLYKLFDVPPVPKIVKQDLNQPIKIVGKTWQEQCDNLWRALVPGNGKASTLQGEALRIVGKLSYEILDNGSINWCSEHKKLVKALANYLQQGNPADEDTISAVESINPDSEETIFNKIAENTVKWISNNLTPIKFDASSANYNI